MQEKPEGDNGGNGGGGANGKGRLKSRKRGVSKSRKDITGWNCKDNGHFKNQCTKLLQNNGTTEVNLKEDIKRDALLSAVETITESWIMNSGASFHACRSREVMRTYRHYRGKVKLEDNKTLDIIGVGDVSVRTTLGTKWNLKDVKFIPDLEKNVDIGGTAR